MRRFIRLVYEILKSIAADVRKDFEPDLIYTPYEPKTIGNRIKGGSE